jgi:tRNA A37 threonylcarbamoyltransferase TsaD
MASLLNDAVSEYRDYDGIAPSLAGQHLQESAGEALVVILNSLDVAVEVVRPVAADPRLRDRRDCRHPVKHLRLQ